MIAIALAASLMLRAPGGLPDSVTADLPGVYRLEVARWRQSPLWACCVRHWTPPDRWPVVWPQVRREAREPFGVWTRSRIAAGERVTFDNLQPGAYRARACRDTTCSAWSGWRSVP